MRKMATIRKIDAIDPIDGADAIEVATVGGWKVVVKKGEFIAGQLAVYCEIDSFIPTAIASFLTKPGHTAKVYEGIEGERLRTIRLRKQLSQGLLLNMDTVLSFTHSFGEDSDVSEVLGILKYEAPVPAQLAGLVKGNFPSQIRKTDQERIQNLKKQIAAAAASGLQFEITEKLEGSSMTVYQIKGEFGVCSRNLDLKRDENNTFWSVAIRDGIEAEMKAVDEHWDFAIQGELVGPGIQGNIYKLSKPEFRVFDVYNIQSGGYLDPEYRRELIGRMGLLHVPFISVDKDLGVGSIDEILQWAEDISMLNPTVQREGIVFKQIDGDMTFKAISNKYLLGEK